MKPNLTAPGSGSLKLKYDNLLSSFAFKFSLRRFIVEYPARVAACVFSNTFVGFMVGGAV